MGFGVCSGRRGDPEGFTEKKTLFYFGTKGKLSPRYIRPYVIIARVGALVAVAEVYVRIKAHPVFHVSMLRKYLIINQDMTMKQHLEQGLEFYL